MDLKTILYLENLISKARTLATLDKKTLERHQVDFTPIDEKILRGFELELEHEYFLYVMKGKMEEKDRKIAEQDRELEEKDRILKELDRKLEEQDRIKAILDKEIAK